MDLSDSGLYASGRPIHNVIYLNNGGGIIVNSSPLKEWEKNNHEAKLVFIPLKDHDDAISGVKKYRTAALICVPLNTFTVFYTFSMNMSVLVW